MEEINECIVFTAPQHVLIKEKLQDDCFSHKNGNKRKRYPKSTDAFRIVHPHFDNYDEHIVIFRQKYYVGRTDKGAFTVFSCRLNRFLSAFGWQSGMIDHAEVTALMNEFLDEPDRSKRDLMLKQFSELLLVG